MSYKKIKAENYIPYELKNIHEQKSLLSNLL